MATGSPRSPRREAIKTPSRRWPQCRNLPHSSYAALGFLGLTLSRWGTSRHCGPASEFLAALVASTLAVPNARADLVYGWGYNGNGELGDGAVDSGSLTPIAVNVVTSDVTVIAAGASSGLAVRSGGVYAWGEKFIGPTRRWHR